VAKTASCNIKIRILFSLIPFLTKHTKDKQTHTLTVQTLCREETEDNADNFDHFSQVVQRA
jgi:hypothetical protein